MDCIGHVVQSRTWLSNFHFHFPVYQSRLYCCCLAAKLYLTLCDPMDYSTPGSSFLHYLPEFAQIHVHHLFSLVTETSVTGAMSPAKSVCWGQNGCPRERSREERGKVDFTHFPLWIYLSLTPTWNILFSKWVIHCTFSIALIQVGCVSLAANIFQPGHIFKGNPFQAVGQFQTIFLNI